MSTRRLIHETYNEHIRLASIPDELRQALRSHERVPSFFTNLERELSHIPSDVSRETIKGLICDLTDTFIKLVMQQTDERQLSDIAKTAIKDEAIQLSAMRTIGDAHHEEET